MILQTCNQLDLRLNLTNTHLTLLFTLAWNSLPMNHPKTPCVFPSVTEMELGTFEGPDGQSAMRVRVEPNQAGYVRLEQLAWSADMGWYCQKSFVIPAAMVRDLITTLRKADCLLPRTTHDPLASLPFRLTAPLPHDEPETQRQDA